MDITTYHLIIGGIITTASAVFIVFLNTILGYVKQINSNMSNHGLDIKEVKTHVANQKETLASHDIRLTNVENLHLKRA